MRTLPPIALLLAALVVVPVVHADADHLASPDAIARPAAVTASDSIAFAMRIMNENLAALSITNYGFIGNNFQSRGPSFEYPLGTGNDHMVRGGLWIGGITFDPTTAQVESLVTAGAVDGSQGSASASATEFTPASLGAPVIVSGARVQGSALYLAANGCEVTAIEPEAAVIERVLHAAQPLPQKGKGKPVSSKDKGKPSWATKGSSGRSGGRG